jgi:hypothetical protein
LAIYGRRKEKKVAFLSRYEYKQPKPGFWDYVTGEENHEMFRDPAYGRWVER